MLGLLPWLLWLVVRQHWARFRGRFLLLRDSDAERLLSLLALPGSASPAMTFPRELQAARNALTRVRLGGEAPAAEDVFWDTFQVLPSDIAGYRGPVRMVFVHDFAGFWTALPWSVPEELAAAAFAAREVTAVFEDDIVSSSRAPSPTKGV